MDLPTPEDLQTLTTADLDELRLLISQETIRREELTHLPTQVDALIQRFVDHGGDKTKIKDPKTYEPKPPKAKSS